MSFTGSKSFRFAKSLYGRYKNNDIQAAGAQLAYYLLLSFFPFLLFLLSLLGMFRLSEELFIAELAAFLPADTAAVVRNIAAEVSTRSSGALLSFSMIGTIWSASKGVDAILKGLNKAYETEESRPFWKVRALSFASTVALAAIVAVAMALLIFGEAAGSFLYRLTGGLPGFETAFGLIKYALPIAVMIVLFALLYSVIPCRRLGFAEVLPGAVFASLGWVLTSVLFQFYVNHYGSYSKTYGSLGGIIVLLIWLYISSIILLLGGEINAGLAANKRTGRKHAQTRAGKPVRL